MKKCLVVCAHPDDETLGLGGTLAIRAEKGEKVFVLIFADGQFARDKTKKGIENRQKQAKKACEILGVTDVKFLNYEDQKLDTIPLVELAGQIESVIKKWKPDTVYTHYGDDVNQDHRKLFEATLVAARPTPHSDITNLICYETPSSTEWGSVQQMFKPNLFVNIDSVLQKKIKALAQYKNEINQYPHPRSIDAIVNRARYWGSTVGTKHAEAFISLREIIGK